MIERVGRPDDPRLADYANVGRPDWLRAHDLFVAEGRLVVVRLLEDGRFPIRSLLVTPAALATLPATVESSVWPVYVAEQDTLNEVAGFNFHRGCLALAQRTREKPAPDDFTHARLLIALEGVGNPDNVGGIFRNALAFGVDGVLLDPSTGDPLYRKAIRTSMAATLRVPFLRVAPWPKVLETLRSRGFHLVALTPDPTAVPIAACAKYRPAILLLGAEGHGLSASAIAAADLRVRIPIAPAVDSLNVTVAAGIALAYWGA